MIDEDTGIESYTIGGRTFRLAYKHLVRPLTDAEETNLLQSIVDAGRVRKAVFVDPDDNVIDGGNRIRFADHLGYGLDRLPVEVLNLTGSEAEEEAVRLNMTGRQLGREGVLHEAIRLSKELKWSNRRIGMAVGVSHQTINNWFQLANYLPVDDVESADGRKRSTKGNKDRPKAEAPPPPTNKPTTKPGVPDELADFVGTDDAAPATEADPYLQKQRDEPTPDPFAKLGDWEKAGLDTDKETTLISQAKTAVSKLARIGDELGCMTDLYKRSLEGITAVLEAHRDYLKDK